MNALQPALAGQLPSTLAAPRGSAGDCLAQGPPALSAFCRLLEEVWRDSEPRLTRLAVGLGMHGEHAADVLQDVYLMAIQKPPPVANATELTRWLFRVTVNRCHLQHRRVKRWQRLWSSLAIAWRRETSNITPHACGELSAAVEAALENLTADDRALVAMRYFSDLNSREIAEIVGISESTVRGRLRLARRMMAEQLVDWRDEG